MAATLTRKGFEAWLAGKADDEVVGWSTTAFACPLACYLKEKDVEGPMIQDTWWCSDSHTPQDLPRWGQRFVARIDDGEELEEAVTAAEARAALAATRQESR